MFRLCGKLFCWIGTDLFTSSDGKLLEDSNVIDEKIHQSQLIAESHQDVKTRWMKGNAICLFSKLLV